jgi:hypothetical protein
VLVPRVRELVLRLAALRGFAVALLREAVLRDDFGAAPVLARFAVDAFAGDLRAPDDRVPVAADFAAVDVDRLAAGFRAAVDRFAVEREAVDLRAPLERPEPPLLLPRDDEVAEPPLLLLAEPSNDHFPLITRCAASATASAMSEPSLVAVDATALAACDAVSAASRPASRIFLRAAGLALIAAAAAARPAASISLLIAALASLSRLLSLEPELDVDPPDRDLEELEREELLRADFAIFSLPASRKRHFKAVPVPK